MSDIKQELDKIRGRISEPSFLKNEGLSNEVGIHVFCYDPADELIVRDFVSRLKAESGTPYHITFSPTKKWTANTPLITLRTSSMIR